MSKYLKWKSFERQVTNAFKQAGWEEAKRNIEQFRKSSGRDILNTEPYCVQTKCGTKHRLLKAYDEAKQAAKKGEIPVVVARYTNRKTAPKTFVFMSFADFMWLIKKGGESNEEDI